MAAYISLSRAEVLARAVATALLTCWTAQAQSSAPQAAFEVASIRPSDPTKTIAFSRSGYRIATTSTSLEWLITWAYDIHTDRLYGKPKWLDSVRYDIVANAPPESMAVRRQPGQVTQLQLMMQALLADRFRLAIHRETRDLPMYALMVAKNGVKVRTTEATGSMGQNPFSMPARGRLIGTGVTAEMLAKVLSDQIGRSVRDQTGLKGIFDFKLEWDPAMWDAEIAAGGEGGLPPADDRGGASLFTAIQEQLGLRLEARKGPVEVLVIDRIERTPTEN